MTQNEAFGNSKTDFPIVPQSLVVGVGVGGDDGAGAGADCEFVDGNMAVLLMNQFNPMPKRSDVSCENRLGVETVRRSNQELDVELKGVSAEPRLNFGIVEIKHEPICIENGIDVNQMSEQPCVQSVSNPFVTLTRLTKTKFRETSTTSSGLTEIALPGSAQSMVKGTTSTPTLAKTVKMYPRSIHLNPPIPVVCSICSKELKNKYVLKNHVDKIHKNNFKESVFKCGKKFKSVGGLNRHQRGPRLILQGLCG